MKKQTIFLAVIIVLYAIIYVFSFDSKLDFNGDNANYLRLAKHLSEGLGYVNVNQNGIAPTNFYPPAYPFLLSLFMSVGIDSLKTFKILDGFFLLLSVLGVFYLVRRFTKNETLSFVIAVLTIFSTQLMHFSNMVMSEMFYLFTSVACFICLYRYSLNEKTVFWKSPYFYLAILTAALTYHIRTIGLTVVFALLVFFMFRKEFWAVLSALGGIVLLFLPWSIRNSSLGLESRYFGTIMTVNPWRPEVGSVTTFGELIDKMIANFDEIVIKGFKEILFPFITIDYSVPSGIAAIILGLFILAVVLYGAWNFGKFRWLMIGYMIANIGLLLLWHGGNGSRYLVTIAPFIFACFYLGIFNLTVLLKLKPKLQSNLPYTFLFMVLLMYSPLKVQSAEAKMPYMPAFENYFNIAKTMEEKAPKHTIVCCRKPELFLYYAPSMYAVNYAYSLDKKAVIKDLIDKKVDYVILDQLGFSSTYRYLYPAIQEYPKLFPIFWQLQNPDTYLLKFERTKAIETLGLNEK